MASATFPLPPMKLLQVFFVGRAEGGGHAHARSLEGGLKRRGIEARCVCVLRSPDTPADGWTTLVRTASPWPLVVPLALLKTFALIRAERPDAVISHTPAASLLVHPIGWLCGVKERVSIHHAPLTRWSRFSRLLRLLDLVYGSSGLTTSTVMVGEMGVRDVSRFPARYRRRVSLIHNEVSPPAVESPVSRTEFGVDSERLLLAFVGRRTISKGADLAARLAAKMEHATIVMAGEAGDADGVIESAVSSGADIRTLGQVDRVTVARLMRVADVLLFPSREEMRPMSVLEAISSGLPIVARDLPELRELIPSEAGMLVSGDETQVWSDAIEAARTRDRAAPDRVSGADRFERMLDEYVELLN